LKPFKLNLFFLCSCLALLLSACALKSGTYDSSVEPKEGVVFGEKAVDPKLNEVIESKVIEVCARSGCWVKLVPPEILKNTGFLLGRFKNKEFSPPSSLKGKSVRIIGRYIRQRYSPSTQKEILTEIGLENLASQVANQPVERMEFEIMALEIL
jgi:hypothetical protein